MSDGATTPDVSESPWRSTSFRWIIVGMSFGELLLTLAFASLTGVSTPGS